MLTARGPRRRYVLLVLDGAADRLRLDGRSPLAVARTPYLDAVARDGVNGLMTTLYEDLPRESLVAHLGMLGWEPHRYYPGGRASSELAAVPNATLRPGDVVFRANLAHVGDGVLRSFSADAIDTTCAAPLVRCVDEALRPDYPDFELYHVGDYRTLLVVRGARVMPSCIRCAEPHASEGQPMQLDRLVETASEGSEDFAMRVNAYLARAAAALAGKRANSLLPWGLSTALSLPSFASVSGLQGRAAIVGAMAFLSGIGAAGGLDVYVVGNGRPDSDFAAKGRAVVQVLEDGYEFVCCHVNAPDEASHLHDPALKVECLQRIDRDIVRPILHWMQAHPDLIGGLLVAPDHYSNSAPAERGRPRHEIHSLEPVPFALWNARDRDDVSSFSEEWARRGRYGAVPVSHLRLLDLLGVRSTRMSRGEAANEPAVMQDGRA